MVQKNEFLEFTISDNQNLLELLELLLEIKIIMRKYTPNFKIPVYDSQIIIENLSKAAKLFIPLISKIGLIDSKTPIEIKSTSKNFKIMDVIGKINDFKEDITISNSYQLFNNIKNNVVLVSTNSEKKKLKSIGIPTQDIKVIGGPIDLNDYKKIGKKIPDNVLENIKKKNEDLVNDLKEIVLHNKTIVFIYSDDEITDNLNRSKINEIEGKIGKNIKIIRIKSWNYL